MKTSAAVDPVAEGEPANQGPGGLRVAMAQVAPVLGDLHRNLALHLEQIGAARRQHADLVVFPELSLTGCFVRDMVPDLAIAPSGPEIAQLIEAAGPMAMVVGLIEESPQHRFYNVALWAEGGRVVHVHRKVYLPTYGLFDEQRYFAAGERFLAFDTARFGRVGILVCEDFWHLSAATIMQAEEVDLLVCVSNSPTRGAEGPKIRMAETYEQFAKTYAQLLGAVCRGGQPRGLRGRIVLLRRQPCRRPRWPHAGPIAHLRSGPVGRGVRPRRAPPPAADYPLGPRRAAAPDDRRTGPNPPATVRLASRPNLDSISARPDYSQPSHRLRVGREKEGA